MNNSTKWCPSCKNEYRQGFSRCPECDTVLVSELPPDDFEQFLPSIFQGTELALLTTVSDDIEFVAVEAFLNQCGVPVLKKHPGVGSYANIYLGKSIYGIEMHVPASMLSSAQEVLRDMSNLINANFDENIVE